jgi:hypothetical protein
MAPSPPTRPPAHRPVRRRELQHKFQSALAEFAGQLAAVHRQAQSDKTDTREELESLLNLIARLDFNGYISASAARCTPTPPPKANVCEDVHRKGIAGRPAGPTNPAQPHVCCSLLPAHFILPRQLGILTNLHCHVLFLLLPTPDLPNVRGSCGIPTTS